MNDIIFIHVKILINKKNLNMGTFINKQHAMAINLFI